MVERLVAWLDYMKVGRLVLQWVDWLVVGMAL